jgi:hypothetical protein
MVLKDSLVEKSLKAVFSRAKWSLSVALLFLGLFAWALVSLMITEYTPRDFTWSAAEGFDSEPLRGREVFLIGLIGVASSLAVFFGGNAWHLWREAKGRRNRGRPTSSGATERRS